MTGGAGDMGTDAYRTRIDAALAEFASDKRSELIEISADLTEFVDAAIEFVAGGKRLRPLFCRAGWLVAGGDPDVVAFDHAAASLEWLQGSALAHDDVMDGSDTRRGRPSLHRDFAERHRQREAAGDSSLHGAAVAILLGDLMLSWAEEHFRRSALPTVASALAWLDRCKNEVTAGQYLDILAQSQRGISVDEALLVVRFKSAKYTVERPLHLGAALAGATPELLDQLTEVALPLGEAFQLRDDVLGVFGDPSATGKPAGDDLREGKRTLLIARAIELGDASDREAIESLLGTPDGVEDLTAIIDKTGARAAVEADITERERSAEAAIERLPTASRDFLHGLLARATQRSR
jgi:geranylgeranyl diphosphate synthase type I